MDDIEGVAEFSRGLDEIEADLRTAIMAELSSAANEMVAIAKGMAPIQSGELAGSFRIDPDPDHLTVRVYAGEGDIAYELHVEAGTAKMEAQPYFWPAYRAVRPALEERLAALLS